MYDDKCIFIELYLIISCYILMYIMLCVHAYHAICIWYGNSLFDITEKYIVIAKYLIKYMIYVWRLH